MFYKDLKIDFHSLELINTDNNHKNILRKEELL